MVRENSTCLISEIVGEVIGTRLKETAIPGKAFVVNGANGIAEPSNGSTDVRIDSLSSCLRKN